MVSETSPDVMTPDDAVWALGLMSGTSLDGVDGATLLTDGQTISRFGPVKAQSYTPKERDVLRAALDWAEAEYAGRDVPRRTLDFSEIDAFRGAREVLFETHSKVEASLRKFFRVDQGDEPDESEMEAVAARARCEISVVGSHGQTLLHRPDKAFTLQLPSGATGQGIHVEDFRSADMRAGGEGAPLAPFFHHACARWAGLTEPVVFLNIGGVANVTWLDPRIADPAEACLAFDTGPGNALVNDWMQARSGEPMDRDGQAAANGKVHRARLASNAAAAFLHRVPPKSLDRNDFSAVLSAMRGLSVEDGAATLTAFTVDCIAKAMHHMPAPPARWLACGGGRHNATMMTRLQARLSAPVEPVEAVGLDGDFLEAQAFAYLAVRVVSGLPTSAPGTTGCDAPVSGGVVSGR